MQTIINHYAPLLPTINNQRPLLTIINYYSFLPLCFFWKVSSLIFDADMKDTKVLQRHVMAQMLMERSILEEETDRGLEAETHVYSL